MLNSFDTFTSLFNAIWGAIAGFGILWLIAKLYKAICKTDGLGGGDMKLLAALGAWCGWQSLPMILLISSATGITTVLIQQFVLRHPIERIAFGPFLAIAGSLSLLGNVIYHLQ